MHNLKLFVTLNQISIIMAITFLNFTQAELNNFLADKRPLHKHMSLESALNSLNNQILWFANPTTWKDPFESRFVMAKYIKNGKEITYPWYNRIFCTCLTQTAASEAYWTPYSQQQIGVEFKINRQVLIKQLEEYSTNYEIFIGRVEYMMTKEIRGALSSIPFSPPIPVKETREWWARLLLLKRNAYRYEDEIRIIIIKKDTTKEKGISLKYSCANTDLIQSIVLDPSIEANTFSMLREIFETKYKFLPFNNKSNKLSHRVTKSQLYAKQKVHQFKL